MTITNEIQLRSVYGYPSDRVRKKDIAFLDKHAKNFIAKSPFLVLSTSNKFGQLDASPRGGHPGFVKIYNDTLQIPDYKGNSRIDSLVNIVETGHVGILFMIPGIDETLRVNGKAKITMDTEVLKEFDCEFKPPISCIVVQVQELFLHCAKAFMRSKLWDDSSKVDVETFPSMEHC